MKRQCTCCGYEFELAAVMTDPVIVPIGMQFEDPDHRYNYFYFNHVCEGCGSTLLIPVLDLLPLIDEPVPDEILTGGETCGGHCTRLSDHAPCEAACRYAPFRRFLLRMLRAKGVPVTDGAEAA